MKTLSDAKLITSTFYKDILPLKIALILSIRLSSDRMCAGLHFDYVMQMSRLQSRANVAWEFLENVTLAFLEFLIPTG